MTKEKFLTVRWNNWLTLALGIPALLIPFMHIREPSGPPGGG